MSTNSAGILLYRFGRGGLQVLLAHPGGPFWAGKDDGAWSIPKGVFDDSEAPLDAARREFGEETGFDVDGRFLALGTLKQRSRKIVHAWALEHDLDASRIRSNTFALEWPKGSGRFEQFPEVDRAQWFDLHAARTKIHRGQREFLDRLADRVANTRSGLDESQVE